MTTATRIHANTTLPAASEAADWAVAWRLMHTDAEGLQPTVAEARLAVWVLLDLGYDQAQIKARTGLTKSQIFETVQLHRRATHPGKYTAAQVAAARSRAPSADERAMLAVAGVTREARSWDSATTGD